MEINQEPEQEERRPRINFLTVIVALIIIIALIAWMFPIYRIKVDPQPERIPTIDELNLNIPSTQGLNSTDRGFIELLNPADSFIKTTANRIVNIGCSKVTKQEKVCHAKVLFYFVRDNINYVNDPVAREYLASPAETLYGESGDCDDYSILLANLLQAVGIQTRYVFVPGHVFVQARIPDALKNYKTELDWVSLDATCSNCEFGELSFQVQNSNKRYL
ncbi:MAG: transglutaminase domain-containing protein [archaeon]|nr:MAG: transglutaminase domain-containing protein [archaeon]